MIGLDYPHYAVELAIALAIGLAILFALVTLWIVAARTRVICRLLGHQHNPFTLQAGADDCLRCDSHASHSKE